MTDYRRMYRLGFTPWERYNRSSGSQVESWIERVSAARGPVPGRAVDLGCGRGLHTARLARHGWEAIGIDLVPEAVAAAQQRDDDGVRYVVGDVTDLAGAGIEGVDLFLDVGCFQGLEPRQRHAMGASVTGAAAPGATLLMLAFGISRYRRLVEGVSEAEIVAALPHRGLLESTAADTTGLGWPMNRTSPRWYRFRLSP